MSHTRSHLRSQARSQAGSLPASILLGLAAAFALVPMVLADAPIKPALPVTSPATPPATTEQEIDQRLEGKFMFLRGFYLDDKLEFDLNGKVVGNPQRGSFTLSGLEIRKVHASKHNIVIEADRIGLHFFGGLPYEDDNKPFERIKLSKKPVEITIDRLNIEPEKKRKKRKRQPPLRRSKPRRANNPPRVHHRSRRMKPAAWRTRPMSPMTTRPRRHRRSPARLPI
jgi:hypothetical protein